MTSVSLNRTLKRTCSGCPNSAKHWYHVLVGTVFRPSGKLAVNGTPMLGDQGLKMTAS